MTRAAADVTRELRSAVNRRADMRRHISALSSGIVSTTREIDRLLGELSALRGAEPVADAGVDDGCTRALPHAGLRPW